MFRVVTIPIATQDIKEAATWYESRQKDLGKKFTTEVRRKVNYIKQSPFSTATRYDQIKTAVLDTFPFMIHYSIDDYKKLVVILAVLHTSRNPDIWKQQR